MPGKSSLTAKQSLFVNEYLIDLNATQAAIRAGYSQKTAGQIGDENLKKPEIKKAIQARMAKREKRTEITQDKVLADIEAIKQNAMRPVSGKNKSMTNHSAALKAAELQGKHLGMFPNKTELSGPGGSAIPVNNIPSKIEMEIVEHTPSKDSSSISTPARKEKI